MIDTNESIKKFERAKLLNNIKFNCNPTAKKKKIIYCADRKSAVGIMRTVTEFQKIEEKEMVRLDTGRKFAFTTTEIDMEARSRMGPYVARVSAPKPEAKKKVTRQNSFSSSDDDFVLPS